MSGSEQIQEMLKRAEEIRKVPIDMVDADSIPQTQSLQYEHICKLVGNLYIEYHHQIRVLQERHEAIVASFEDKIRELASRNRELENAGTTPDK